LFGICKIDLRHGEKWIVYPSKPSFCLKRYGFITVGTIDFGVRLGAGGEIHGDNIPFQDIYLYKKAPWGLFV